MAYIRMVGPGSRLGTLNCGPRCACPSCRTRFSGLGERYIRDEDYFQRLVPEPAAEPIPEPAPGPPAAAPRLRNRPGPSAVPPSSRSPRRPPAVASPTGIPAGAEPAATTPGPQLEGLGWTVRFLGASEGHEKLTRDAIGVPPGSGGRVDFQVGGIARSASLSPRDIEEIVQGNRSVDLGWHGTGVLFAFAKDEQKRHALRREYGQPQPLALRDIVASLRAQHSAILAERNPQERLRKIGRALHLVQDSFSPAHTCRRPASSWCVAYVRNYGRGGFTSGGVEHRVPKDPRDELSRSGSTDAAAQATHASRQYLQIVFKALYGQSSNPDAARARSEAADDLNRFIAHRFRGCLEPEGHRYCRP